MKYISLLLLLIASIYINTSCGKEDKVEGELELQATSGQVFYATTEGHTTQNTPGSPNTKVYADENMQVLWNEDDRISVFNKTTYNYQYLFTGEDGDNYGSFEEIPVTGLISGNNLTNIYAVYPYSKSNKVNNAGTAITMTLPAEQTYKEHSFGIGANSMIAVTDNNFLAFKNVGGYLSLRLYGNNVSIASISIKGNNNEKIAGKASIAVSTSTVPVTTMDNSTTDEITLVCDPPVQIGSTAENYTDFWFVIPPVTFSNGFTITVTDALGGTFIKSTTRSFTVTRNQMDWMNPLQVQIAYDEENTYVPFEDANFKAYCVENFDTNSDGEISIAEAKVVTEISVLTDKNHRDIKSLKGIEFFTNLLSLKCSGQSSSSNPGQLTSLVLTNNTALTVLNCGINQLSSLDVSNNTALTSLSCSSNQLTSLDVNNNTALTSLSCGSNQLTSLDVSNNTALTSLSCGSNQLTSLDVNNNTALTSLRCYSNQLTSLDVSNNTDLTYLDCSSNQLTSLDVSHNTALTSLSCASNQLTSLDVNNNTTLTYLHCSSNQLTSLDVNNNTALTTLWCASNQLTSLYVNNNTALTTLWCASNQLTSLDVSNNTALTSLSCYSNQLTSLDVSNKAALKSLSCDSNQLTSLDVSNNTALKSLNCSWNQLTSLDVSKSTALTDLICDSNQLTSLDVSNNTALTYLRCDSNQLTSLDVVNNTALTNLRCCSNLLTSLDVSNNTALTALYAWPQNGTLGHLYKKTGQSISFKEYYGQIINPSDYGTTIVEVD